MTHPVSCMLLNTTQVCLRSGSETAGTAAGIQQGSSAPTSCTYAARADSVVMPALCALHVIRLRVARAAGCAPASTRCASPCLRRPVTPGCRRCCPHHRDHQATASYYLLSPKKLARRCFSHPQLWPGAQGEPPSRAQQGALESETLLPACL
jgi:hypothetical protein